MNSNFSLKNKNIVLTGATGFFGRTFARGILEAGAQTLIMIDVNAEVLNLFSDELKKAYGDERIVSYVLDQDDHTKSAEVYSEINSKLKVDGLVNNSFSFSKTTGFNTDAGRLENATYDQLKASFDSGIYWAIQATQAFGLLMKIGFTSIVI